MSVQNISLFHSVLDEALERLGKKNLKLKECQYEAVKAVVVDRKHTICVLLTGYGKSLLYQLLPYCGLLNLFICNACALRATYSFLYVDHGLSQGLRFLLKGSKARGTRLSFCMVEGMEKLCGKVEGETTARAPNLLTYRFDHAIIYANYN